MMLLETLRRTVCRRPGAVVACWVAAAVLVALTSPSLSKLAARGQSALLPEDTESARADELIQGAWPDQSYDSLVVVALVRGSGLTPDDHDYARRLAERFQGPGRPSTLLRVLGPGSPPEIAERLVTPDRTTELLLLPLGRVGSQQGDPVSFVSPATAEAVQTLQQQAAGLPPPSGLEVRWTGNAVLGRDYMDDVQVSLDRAAMATVVLLLVVLLAVYRSLLLSLVPLVTIGISLVIARGMLAWLGTAGWALSPLVELFLVVVLFGSGTDFCLFLSWRFGEHWNAANPAGAMRTTLQRAGGPLLTSAGTVIIGLSLMGLTHFKLFSSTGPSVALGLALTVVASLTLAPALLVLVARHRPRAFAGLTAPASGFWDEVGHKVLARPLLVWCLTILLMMPAAVLGLGGTTFIQDLVSDLPADTPSVQAIAQITDPPETRHRTKFRQGDLDPLAIVLRSNEDLRQSEGLALIDDVSRLLTHQRHLVEVRSATQPLGDPALLAPARLAERLRAVNQGFTQLGEGASQLEHGLTEGAAKLRTAILLEDMTGFSLTGTPPSSTPAPSPTSEGSAADPLVSGLKKASAALLGTRSSTPNPNPNPNPNPPASPPAEPPTPKPKPSTPTSAGGPREQMLHDLTRAASGAGQIADGARRAQHELSTILQDPVGRRSLDRLLITPETVRENPDLLRSFATYISADGHLARIDVVQPYRIFSPEALDQVETLRRRLADYLVEEEEFAGKQPRALVTGTNAESADIRALTERDQREAWVIVPLGVLLVLLVALRDVWACLNLVATMLLTYAFALGITHLVFVTGLGAEGIDWKVPYFLFVLLVAVGVDYNVFLMTRLQEEVHALGLRPGIGRAIAQTGGLISSAAAITACSFASFMFSPLSSIVQLGFALVVGIAVDAALVRPVLVPCGQYLMNRHRERRPSLPAPRPALAPLAQVSD